MTQPSKNGENAVDMLAVARIAQGVDIAGFAGPMPSSWWHRRK